MYFVVSPAKTVNPNEFSIRQITVRLKRSEKIVEVLP